MHVCDNCKKELDTTGMYVKFGYPSIEDGNEFEFCSDRCGLAYLGKKWIPKLKKHMKEREEDLEVIRNDD